MDMFRIEVRITICFRVIDMDKFVVWIRVKVWLPHNRIEALLLVKVWLPHDRIEALLLV